MFEVGEGLTLQNVFDSNNIEIYKRSKDYHLNEISKKTGVPLQVGFLRHFILRGKIRYTLVYLDLRLCIISLKRYDFSTQFRQSGL